MAFLSSTDKLPDGTYQREIEDEKVWAEAKRMGLLEGEYGRRWFVYESKAEYLESLD